MKTTLFLALNQIVVQPARALVDSDGNGLSDVFKSIHFGGPANPVGSKKSNLPIFNDLQGDQEIARRPLQRLSLVDELKTNAGVCLRFG